MRSILLQLHIGQPMFCEAWTRISTSNGVQITVYSNGTSSLSDNCARQCFAAIQRSLRMSGGQQKPAPCIVSDNRIYGAYTCAGAVTGLHKRVLIYIADGSATIDHNILSYFLHQSAVIIPVVDVSLGPNPGAFLPPAFNTQVAEPVQNFDATPVIPRILRAAGILAKDLRLFISYKHDDAAVIAGQLFHALSERMFDVFLDRFSSRTGDDFVGLIKEELSDKACILVLETKDIDSSKYCHQEVGTATTYYLGMMAIDLPGSKQIFPQIQKRHDLRTASLVNNTLSPSDIDSIVAFVEANYDHEIARRPRAQDLALYHGILAANLTPVALGIGQYRVNNGYADYLLSMNRCPPEVDDFIDIEEKALVPPVAKGVLLGPITVLRTLRASQVSWLGNKSNVQTIDEGFAMRTLHNISLNQPL